ncbi:MAG: hypothetical protein ABI621_16535 [Chloroflexota bacterium]
MKFTLRARKPFNFLSAVAFLASPQAAHIQGAILDVEGGAMRTLWG